MPEGTKEKESNKNERRKKKGVGSPCRLGWKYVIPYLLLDCHDYGSQKGKVRGCSCTVRQNRAMDLHLILPQSTVRKMKVISGVCFAYTRLQVKGTTGDASDYHRRCAAMAARHGRGNSSPHRWLAFSCSQSPGRPGDVQPREAASRSRT